MRPKICAVLTQPDPVAAKSVAPLVDLFEVRIDLVGSGWRELVRDLGKPWVACNRIDREGGRWQGSEASRLDELLEAVELGAGIVDIELSTRRVEKFIVQVNNKVTCLVSHHDFIKTPAIGTLRALVDRQLAVGADICKVVTTAVKFEDNLTVLKLVTESAGTRLVSFAMGPLGIISRVISPLAGAEFTYASIEPGKESAPGQVTAAGLRTIYEMVTFERHIGQN